MPVSNGMILIDTREHHQDYIKKYFDSIGDVNSVISCLSHGMDYLIINGTQSVGVQRKTCDEVFQQMEEIRNDVVPSLKELTENPVLLVEENFHVGKDGHMYRRQGGFLVEVGLTAYSYYNFLNSIRLMGCEVVCTRNLDQSIWWMIATYKYIGRDDHYPKQKKGHTHIACATGALCCVNNFGSVGSKKLLSKYSLRELAMLPDKELRGCMSVNQYMNFVKTIDAKVESEPEKKVV